MSEENGNRTEELSRAVATIKVRGMTLPLDRWLMLAGGLFIAIGIPLIILGWFGAARTPYVFEQIPYLISGGVLGLAFAVVGGLCYFAYWMTRQVNETRRQADRIDAAFGRLEAILTGGTTFTGTATASSSKDPANGATFYVTKQGTMFHRADCAVVQGRQDLRKVKGSEPDLKPCGICDPLGVSA